MFGGHKGPEGPKAPQGMTDYAALFDKFYGPASVMERMVAAQQGGKGRMAGKTVPAGGGKSGEGRAGWRERRCQCQREGRPGRSEEGRAGWRGRRCKQRGERPGGITQTNGVGVHENTAAIMSGVGNPSCYHRPASS